jgi:hypothetical protein
MPNHDSPSGQLLSNPAHKAPPGDMLCNPWLTLKARRGTMKRKANKKDSLGLLLKHTLGTDSWADIVTNSAKDVRPSTV